MRKIISFLLVMLLIVSCQQEHFTAPSSQRITRIVMSAQMNEYDDAQQTRTVSSMWQDKDSIFLVFDNAGSTKNAVAVFDAVNGIWKLEEENLALHPVSSADLRGYYLGKNLAIKNSEATLSPTTPIYMDESGKYNVSSDGSLEIQLTFGPMYGRVRFKGEPGTEISVSGISSPYTFDLEKGKISTTPATAYLTVKSDGYTPYIYGSLDENEREINLLSDNGYTMTCSSKVLTPQKSGWMNIPTEASHDGWKMIDGMITVGKVSFKMIKVEGGTFTMGATPEQGSDANSNEKPAHQVTLSSFYIGETEVTQALWYAVMDAKPSSSYSWKSTYGLGDEYPAYYISWNECQTFIQKLNALTGKNFRLPTEAEWEYAARGGNKSKGYKYSGSNTIGDVAWYDENSSGKTHPVKTKLPNELGIYDMSGNVWEWCQDWYGNYSSSSQTNPTGPSSGSYRVFRGGSWFDYAWDCRSSFRHYDAPYGSGNDLGLRLVLSE